MTGTLAVLTNIPTPYRVAFFDTLGLQLRALGGRIEVFYCADTEHGRYWEFKPGRRGGARLPGISPRVRGVTYHMNPTSSRRIRAVHPDWLLVAGSWNTPTMLYVSSRERGRVPRIFWSEGHAAAVLHPKGPVATARRRALSSFDGFAVPNERSEMFLRTQISVDKPMVRLPNTVDEEFFDPRSVDVAAVRRRLGFSEECRVLAVVASLEARKRVIETVQAFRSLTEGDRRGTQLVIVGTGSQRRELERAADGQLDVHLMGQRTPEEVRDILSMADGFLLASRIDPNPLSVIEAGSCGCHIMTTESVGNSHELVKPSGGILIPDGSGDDVLEGIREAIRAFAHQSNDALSRSGSETRRFVVSRYSRSAVACSLISELMRTWPPKGGVGEPSEEY